MSDIAKFLARVIPWPSATLAGYVNVHWPSKRKSPQGDSLMPGRAFQQQQTAVGFVNGMLRNPVDLYLCMSLQAQTFPPRLKNGREQRPAIRKKENAVALRSFYLDVDIQKGEFSDTTHALTEFGQWRRKVGLPMPSMIVMSGSGGFHVYWVLQDPITLETWLPIAEALKVACQQEGFKADDKITADAARVLRIPGTFNQKHQPPRLAHIGHEGPDYALVDIATPLAPYKQAYAPRVTVVSQQHIGKPSAVFAGVPLPGRLDAGIETYVPTIEEVADECPFIDATLQTGGAGYAEPLWFESLKVAYYVQEGEEVAHELSDGHATYAERETDAKFDEIVKSHANQRIGWPQCRSIHDAGAQECRYCPHLQQGRSPLNFAKPLIKAAASVAAATSLAVTTPVPASAMPTQPEWLPTPYQHDREKKVYMDVPDPKDENRIVRQYVLPMPLFNLAVYEKGTAGGNHMFGCDVEVRNDMVRHVAASFPQIMDTRQFSTHVGEAGVLGMPVHIHRWREFMTAFVHQLREARQRVAVYNSAPFGWYLQEGKYHGFVFNQKMYNTKDPVPIQPLSPRFASKYTPIGDLSVWKGVLKLIADQQRPELIAPICASIGAPLMRMAGLNGAALHLWGDSGSGKSAALKLAQSIWGNPGVMAQLEDTTNSIDVLMSQLHTLPVIYDEMLKGLDRRLVNMFMRLSGGSSKKRSRRDGQDLGEMHTWFLLLISASNPPMHPHLAEFEPTNVAPINRVFEYQVTQNQSRVGMLDRGSEAERLFGLLNDNYGLAGLELAKFYGANYDAVAKLLAALTDAIDRRGHCTPDDRYYRVILGIILAGGMIGNKLGLFNIDMDQMEGFLIERLQDLQSQRKTTSSNFTVIENVERLLAEFIAANRSRALITQDVWTGAGRSPAGWTAGTSNAYDLKGMQVDIRIGLNQKIIRISQPAFNAWLKKERRMTFGDVKKPLMALPNTRLSQWDLGHGAMTMKSTRIWALQITDPSFWDFN